MGKMAELEQKKKQQGLGLVWLKCSKPMPAATGLA